LSPSPWSAPACSHTRVFHVICILTILVAGSFARRKGWQNAYSCCLKLRQKSRQPHNSIYFSENFADFTGQGHALGRPACRLPPRRGMARRQPYLHAQRRMRVPIERPKSSAYIRRRPGGQPVRCERAAIHAAIVADLRIDPFGADILMPNPQRSGSSDVAA
jgi:hypothetical protein